jgi:hypothetical protein
MNFFYVRMGDITNAAKYRLNSAKDGVRMVAVWPKAFQTIFIQKHSSKVGLRVQIDSQDLDAMVGKHPGEMVYERCFSYAALVIEESDGFHAGLRKILTNTLCSSNSNMAWGFPFCASNA